MGSDPDHVVAVVCGNGLGHYRRTVAILALLVQRRQATKGKPLHVTLVAESWQRDLTQGWWAADVLDAAGATWIGGVVDPGVSWSTSVDLYDDGRLLGWVERLREVDELAGADLVLSDNLPQVLTLRSDAVLAGSFLWSDVLAAAHSGSPPVDRFVEQERALLRQHRPPMLCVGAAAMPGVLTRTDAVELPWMCDPSVVPRIPDDGIGAVAVLGGRTGAADDLLAASAALLVAEGREVLVQDGLDVDGAEPFSFATSWSSTDVVLCRPGMGTLTDAVAAQVPVVALHEASNVELAHNAAVVARLALGEAVPPGATAADTAAAVRRVLAPEGRQRTRTALAAQRRDGLDRAAEWLDARLASTGAP